MADPVSESIWRLGSGLERFGKSLERRSRAGQEHERAMLGLKFKVRESERAEENAKIGNILKTLQVKKAVSEMKDRSLQEEYETQPFKITESLHKYSKDISRDDVPSMIKKIEGALGADLDDSGDFLIFNNRKTGKPVTLRDVKHRKDIDAIIQSYINEDYLRQSVEGFMSKQIPGEPPSKKMQLAQQIAKSPEKYLLDILTGYESEALHPVAKDAVKAKIAKLQKVVDKQEKREYEKAVREEKFGTSKKLEKYKATIQKKYAPPIGHFTHKDTGLVVNARIGTDRYRELKRNPEYDEGKKQRPEVQVNVGNIEKKIATKATAEEKAYLMKSKSIDDAFSEAKDRIGYRWNMKTNEEKHDEALKIMNEKVMNTYPDAIYAKHPGTGQQSWFIKVEDGYQRVGPYWRRKR